MRGRRESNGRAIRALNKFMLGRVHDRRGSKKTKKKLLNLVSSANTKGQVKSSSVGEMDKIKFNLKSLKSVRLDGDFRFILCLLDSADNLLGHNSKRKYLR